MKRATDRLEKSLARYGDLVEKQALNRIEKLYMNALVTGLHRHRRTLEKALAAMSGALEPPSAYVAMGEQAVQAWRSGFVKELLRQGNVIEGIAA